MYRNVDLIVGRFALHVLAKALHLPETSPFFYVLKNYDVIAKQFCKTVDFVLANLKTLFVTYI
jgi:hypothetical protein